MRPSKATATTLVSLLALYVFWGTEYLIIKIAVQEVPPFLLAALNALIAGVAIFAVMIAKKQMRPTKDDIKSTFLSGFFLVFCSAGLIPVSIVHLDSGLVALLAGLSPAIAIAADSLLLKVKKPNGLIITGLVLGLMGLVSTVIPALGENPSISLLGVALATVSAILWSVGILVTRHAKYTLPVLARNSLQLIFGGVLLLATSYLIGEWRSFNILDISSTAIFCILYITISSSLVGYSAYLWLLKNAPLPVASSTAYVCPIVALIVGAAFGGETLTMYTAVAVICIISSLVFLAGGLKTTVS